MSKARWKRIGYGLCFLPIFALLCGCGMFEQRTGGTVSVVTPDFFGVGEGLARQLVANMSRPLNKQKRLILTTIVNIDDLYQTSRFGRTLSESLSTRLFSHGFGVIDVRKSDDLLIKNGAGELMLTRDAALIAHEHEAEAIIAGTYALTAQTVIVNVKMLDAGSRDVISVAGLEIQRSSSVDDLLAGSFDSKDVRLSAYER